MTRRPSGSAGSAVGSAHAHPPTPGPRQRGLRARRRPARGGLARRLLAALPRARPAGAARHPAGHDLPVVRRGAHALRAAGAALLPHLPLGAHRPALAGDRRAGQGHGAGRRAGRGGLVLHPGRAVALHAAPLRRAGHGAAGGEPPGGPQRAARGAPPRAQPARHARRRHGRPGRRAAGEDPRAPRLRPRRAGAGGGGRGAGGHADRGRAGAGHGGRPAGAGRARPGPRSSTWRWRAPSTRPSTRRSRGWPTRPRRCGWCRTWPAPSRSTPASRTSTACRWCW